MNVDLSRYLQPNITVAVALSGGSDSMALLNIMLQSAKVYQIKVVALNVEHGIRGESSISDSKFVKDYCQKMGVPLLSYSVDSVSFATENKLSIEHAARQLRYSCFFDAINSGKCDKIATAHHLRDNVESVLINLCRGTGLKGVTGITDNFDGKIIRPLLSISKEEIDEYIEQNDIPYVTDESNLSDEYSRNYIRHNVLPTLLKVFPEAERNINKFTEIAKIEDQYLDNLAKRNLFLSIDRAEIYIPVDKAIFNRCAIMALRYLGIEKDWEKIHVDNAFSLIDKENGSSINLPKNVVAIKEYDKIVFFKPQPLTHKLPFAIGSFGFGDKTFRIERASLDVDLTSGLYLDAEKIPADTLIRSKRECDQFTKFGGGTKSLGDFFTDKKIPSRLRDSLPLLASGNTVLAIFGVAVSDKVKVDENTKTVLKLS